MRNLVLTAIALFAVAVAAPQLLDSKIALGPETGAEEAPRIAAPARARNDWRSGDIRIRAKADGHFYVDAKVNGRNIALVVDTGASIVALRESDARRAGIRIRRSDFDAPISTANGTAYAADVTLSRVSVGAINVRNVRAVVIPDDRLSVSLLGASFLNELRRFEVSDNILVLEN
jgi:aspartyl protease family protein